MVEIFINLEYFNRGQLQGGVKVCCKLHVNV